MRPFDELFHANRKAVAAFLRRRFGRAFSDEEIHDLLQETYVTGSRAYGRTAVRCPRTWLHQVAISRAQSRLRDRRRHPEDALDQERIESLPASDDGILDPEAAVIAFVEAFRLRAAVAELPPLLREAVELFYFRELKGSEASAVTGVKAVTLRSRLFRAVRVLRVKLAEDEAGLPPPEAEEAAARIIETAPPDMSPDQREVFLMRTVEETGFAEIAERAAVPENTAESRMRHAPAKLRETALALEDDEADRAA